jgi:hypothetical protein
MVSVKSNRGCTETAKSEGRAGGGECKTYFNDGGGRGLLRLYDDTVSSSGYVAPNGGSAESLIITIWLYSSFCLGRIFSFLILYTVGLTPWRGDQPVARLHTQ